MKRYGVLGLLFLGFLFIFLSIVLIFLTSKDEISTISINGQIFSVEVVKEEQDLKKGLSFRNGLERNHVMLFVFPNESFWGIWMKDMNFPIDVVWLNDDKKVVHFVKDMKPETFPKVFYPEQKARYVVEMSMGNVENNQIKIGDTLIFK
jgi:uncharacterized membrane protein (UPF0127 family)